MIDTRVFLSKVDEIANESPSYRSGGYGKDGTCDCIGLIIGAIRRAGGSWSGTHGSNYTARNEMAYLRKITTASDLIVGEVVFKAHEPGESGYDANTINRKYASSSDKRDYYHVGVVVSVTPLRIRHMTTPEPKMDTKLGKWSWHGWLKKISMGGGEIPVSEAHETLLGDEIVISGGNLDTTVNMRSGPSKDRKIIYDIPQGSAGKLLSESEKWCKVEVNGRTGYVQSNFVTKVGQDDGHVLPVVDEMISVPRKDLEHIYNLVRDMLGYNG